jgi:hypothetical protein
MVWSRRLIAIAIFALLLLIAVLFPLLPEAERRGTQPKIEVLDTLRVQGFCAVSGAMPESTVEAEYVGRAELIRFPNQPEARWVVLLDLTKQDFDRHLSASLDAIRRIQRYQLPPRTVVLGPFHERPNFEVGVDAIGDGHDPLDDTQRRLLTARCMIGVEQ